MKKLVILGTLAIVPALASAQEFGNIENLIRAIGRLVDISLPVVLGLALLGFFWGLAKFVFSADKDAGEAKSLMGWSLVALFVMVSVWGLVGFIGRALNVGQGSGNNPNTPNVPTVPLR